jgi:hypothetical protein
MRPGGRELLLFLAVPLVLLALFPMDLAPGRFLVTFPADRFEPWGPPRGGPAYNSDCLRSYLPRRAETVRALRSGRIPLWDPSSFCGQPFLANFQSGVFYPPNLLLLPFSAERSLGIFAWIHLAIAGWGGLLLLRSIGLSPGTALIGGLLYATNGALAVRAGQITMLAAAAWIPLVLFLSRRTVRGGSVVPLAIAFACMTLAGFPPILLWGTLLAFFWTLHEQIGLGRAEGMRPFLRAAGGFLLGGALAAAQLLPTAEFLLSSDRIRFTYEELVSSSWHPAALIRFLVPGWFGSPIDGDSWVELLRRGNGHYYQSFLSTAGYVGIASLLFAVLGAAEAWRNRSVRFLLIAGAAALFVLLGSPLLHVVSLLPGLAGSRIDRIVHLVTLPLAILAAFGMERARREAFSRRAAGAAALVLGLLLLGLWAGRERIAERLIPQGTRFLPSAEAAAGRHARAALFLSGGALLVFLPIRARRARFFLPAAGLLLVADSGLEARRCHVTVGREGLPSETAETRFLREAAGEGRVVRFRDLVFPPGLPGLFGIPDVEGYNALTFKNYRAYYQALAPESVKERRINPLVDPNDLSSPLLCALGARWILTRSPLGDGSFPLRHEGRFLVYENRRAVPRAYLAEKVLFAPNDPERAIALLEASSAGSRIAVLEERVPGLPQGEPDLPAGGAARIVSSEPERVVIECAADRPGLLVLADSYDRGWRARVDGLPAKVHRVNRIFRGVSVGAGEHRVEFRYEPLSFAIGVWVSLLALAALLVVPIRCRRAKRLRTSGESR